MSDNVRVHIGTPEDMGRRFVDAWHRAERGEAVSETNVTFRDLEALLAALTPRRLHLLPQPPGAQHQSARDRTPPQLQECP